ncbi:hypothetical protein Dsin_022777 [Dipteronia sinensis]|uniref:Uncharacterized protein n=1 Tax=Dipteronia sinensis TaxID=43782 RepID=A0AAE0E1G4_9ROSI|nr:hypothetical protein Dsin_022777 [Dipteronia sinensis]
MVNFTPDQDIPDLAGKVIIVTGGSDGLGKESVLQLSKHNAAHIYLAARSQSKAESAIEEIKSKSPNACPISFLELDLASFASIKSAASTFQASNSRLDLLLCNAGLVGVTGTTKDGYETTFGVNHVGHALFIKLLLPLVLKTAKEQPTSDVRVIVLASEAEMFAPKKYYLLEDAEIKSDLISYSKFAKYGHSKIANIHYVQQLAKHYPEEEHRVKFASVHPGAVVTNLGSGLVEQMGVVGSVLRKVINVVLRMATVEEGAKNQLWALTAEGVKHGEYYVPVGVSGKGSARIKDEGKAVQLWDWTEKELAAHA